MENFILNKFNIILALGFSFVLSASSLASEFSSLVQVNGPPVTINSKSKKLYIYFWATWCPECKKKIMKGFPSYKAMPDQQLLLLSTEKKSARVKKYAKKYKIPYPVFVDPSRSLIKELKVKAVPAWGVWVKVNNSWKLKSYSIGTLKE